MVHRQLRGFCLDEWCVHPSSQELETAEEEQTPRLSYSHLSTSRGNAEAFLNSEHDSEHLTRTNRFNSQLPSVEGTTSVLADDDKLGPGGDTPWELSEIGRWQPQWLLKSITAFRTWNPHLGVFQCLDLFDTLPLSLG